MKTTGQNLYASYKDIVQKAADIYNASAVLGWDQEVYMPPKSAEFRSRQLATLASKAHELLTSDTYAALLQKLSAATDLDDTQTANVRLSLEDYEKNKKLSPAFVEELSKQSSESFNCWVDARKKNDFSIFADSLTKMIALKRQQADLYGYTAHPYDALMDDYEKGATVAMLDPIFEGIKKDLPLLLDKIKAAPQVDDSFLKQHFAKQPQWDFSIEIITAMGFDFEAGRQDYSEHPFTTSFSPTDVRITTRVDEQNYEYMLWSSIHEGGHGLYEQGLPEEQYGLPLGQPASLSIHESQSRFWENCIGRSEDFWQHFYPRLRNVFKSKLNNIPLPAFYKAINKVQPSFIRTEADEVTYHFHVLIRYEIEKALIEGSLDPKDLQHVWNEKYQQYLGVTPPDDKRGVLQDVHWSHGSFGYFPTYSLGSFYAAQFLAQARKDIVNFETDIHNGAFSQLLHWLREHIHKYGRRYTSEELCKMVTGKPLDVNIFMGYINKKYADVYDIKN